MNSIHGDVFLGVKPVFELNFSKFSIIGSMIQFSPVVVVPNLWLVDENSLVNNPVGVESADDRQRLFSNL